MVEIIVTIALEAAKCLAPSVERQISYLREHKSNFKNLKAEVEKLKQKHTSIQHKVDEATRNGEVIEDFVQNWLERTSKIINEAAAKFTEDEETAAKKRCFKGLCPDLKTRHQLSKQAVEQLNDLSGILKEAESFSTISYRIPPTDPRLSNENYESFKSRLPSLKDVISSLSNPDLHMVGIYGMGGVGKTTLAKEVAKEAERKKLFDRVVFAEVSHNLNINKIQGEIADTLGLTLSNKETDSGRAGELSQRLKNEKKILIILDNIWGHLDLQAIGIPVGEEHKGCKILLTSRSVDVLARQMDSQQNFSVEVLNDEEAWSLFKKMNGDKHLNIEGSKLKSVATQVTKRCGGLPIAIVTVARALRNRELFEWKNALLKLRMSPSKNIEGMHATIELSYDHLKNDLLKKTILLIGYAGITSIDTLMMYGMGLDLFEGINNMEERHDEVRTLVKQLQDSCLLLESNTTNEDFSMHDVVRDAAISIAFRDWYVFTNELVHELEWPDVNTLKVYPSIVLQNVKADVLPPVLECQQLKLFSVSAAASDSSFEIHDAFFTTLTKLKVLVLANMHLWSLPSSLGSLTNLRALGLYKCQLDGIAIIGDLKKLEILSFKNSYIRKLPVEIGHLTQLKSLDLRDGWNLEVIPPNVISSLSHLEELYMGDFDEWEEERPDEDRKNASLDELKRLTKLTCLEILITDRKTKRLTLPTDLSFKNLERYKIEIRHVRSRDRSWNRQKSFRKFRLSSSNTNICLNEGHILQLKGIEDLCLYDLKGVKSVVYGLDKDGFPQLKYLQIHYIYSLLCVVDSKDSLTSNAFPLLESLDLFTLFRLEKICRGEVTAESFSQLKMIKVERCGKLENIFSFSIARRLEQLQSVNVVSCWNMKEIFVIEREDESNYNIELRQLRSLTLDSLPKLRSLCSTSQQRRDEIVSNALFSEKVVLPNLELLELYQLKLVDCIWENQVAALSCGIQNLTRLIISDCHNLRRLSSSFIASSFVQLQHLEIKKCDALEEIAVFDERKDVVFPQLQFLEMKFLKNLTKFCSGDCIEFPSLKELKIEECPKLTEFLVKNNTSTHSTDIPLSFFNDKVALPRLETLIMTNINKSECDEVKFLFGRNMYRELLRLESLSVSGCGSLDVIFDVRVEVENKHDCATTAVVTQLSKLDIVGLPKLKHVWNKDPRNHKFLSFEKLTTVKIVGCDRLKNVFPASVASNLSQLKSLDISKCGVEEIVFVDDEGAETNPRLFVFPRVISLRLHMLPNFTAFFPGLQTTSKWPALKLLEVSEWKMVMSLGLQETTDLEEGQPGRFLVEKVFPNLKYLIVELDSSKVILSLDFLQKLHNMKMLQITGGYSEISDTDVGSGMSAVIRHLDNCSDLKYILREESNMDHLVHLEVNSCGNLVNLAASSTSFQNLTTLSVYRCQTLTKILTFSTTKSLVRLREMKISQCRMITKIVAADEEDEAKDYEIVFRELKVLYLLSLESLSSFCSANSTLKFPSLEDLVLSGCPKMKSFSGGELSSLLTSSTAKSLARLRQMEIFKCNMITEIVAANEAKDYEIVFTELKWLYLSNLESLTSFCSTNCTLKFPSLESLTVRECPKMKSFSKGELSTPNLHKIKRYWTDLGSWNGDVNTTIQQLHEEMKVQNSEED